MALAAKTGMMTFPQVVVDDQLGGRLRSDKGGGRERPAGGAARGLSDVPARRSASAPTTPPRARLAALTDIGAAPADHHLDDRGATPRAGQALAAVNEEAILEGAAHAVDVAKVVDRGPASVDPFASAPRSHPRVGARTGRARAAQRGAVGGCKRETAPRRRRCCRRRRRAVGRAGRPSPGRRARARARADARR